MHEKYIAVGQRIQKKASDDDPFLRLILECRSTLSRSPERIAALVEGHPEVVNQQGLNGKPAVFFAIDSHSYEAVRLLVEAGADLSKQYQDMTPLEYAVYMLYSQGNLQDREEPILKIVCFLTKKTCDQVKKKENRDTMSSL